MSVCTAGVVVWEWLNDGGRWLAYEPRISDYIEGFQTGVVHLGKVDPSLGCAVVDLSAMIQQDRGFAGNFLLYPYVYFIVLIMALFDDIHIRL
jgi:WWE domain